MVVQSILYKFSPDQFKLKTMMKNRSILTMFLCFVLTICNAQFSEKSKDYQKFTGLFDFYYDAENDKMFLEVDELEKEFL